MESLAYMSKILYFFSVRKYNKKYLILWEKYSEYWDTGHENSIKNVLLILTTYSDIDHLYHNPPKIYCWK